MKTITKFFDPSETHVKAKVLDSSETYGKHKGFAKGENDENTKGESAKFFGRSEKGWNTSRRFFDSSETNAKSKMIDSSDTYGKHKGFEKDETGENTKGKGTRFVDPSEKHVRGDNPSDTREPTKRRGTAWFVGTSIFDVIRSFLQERELIPKTVKEAEGNAQSMVPIGEDLNDEEPCAEGGIDMQYGQLLKILNEAADKDKKERIDASGCI